MLLVSLSTKRERKKKRRANKPACNVNTPVFSSSSTFFFLITLYIQRERGATQFSSYQYDNYDYFRLVHFVKALIMFTSKSEYDRGVNTFSPEGRIFQIEYAIEAIKLGSTSLGIQTPEGVVLAAEKRVPSTLVVPSSMNKIMEVDSHIAAVMSGMVADARILVEHARVESQNHRFTYNEPMCVESCTLATCDLSIQFGESGGRRKLMSRPFGVSLLIAGVDEKGPQLWQTDPSGTYTRYDAQAIGGGAEAAQNVFTERYHRNMSLQEGEVLAVDILKQVMEDQLSPENIEVAVVRVDDGKLHMYSPTEIKAIIARLAE